MLQKHHYFFILLCLLSQLFFGQISGFVLDSQNKAPIEYATIVIKKGTEVLDGTISKKDGSFDLISIGHRNHQGLFYYTDEFKNQFVINSEHGPKGGDEININNLKDNKVQNFGWPISSYGIN